MLRLALTILIMLPLAACEQRGDIVIAPAAGEVGTVERVFIGTTRGPDPATGELFGKTRSQDPRYLRLDISVPPDRDPGRIVWPKKKRKLDPATQFLATDEVVYNGVEGFERDLAAAFAKRPRKSREAVVFVHGYNNNLAEGAYRLAQMGHDLSLKGVFVHYSWPSRAHPLGYAYDRDSALFARDGLEELLSAVADAGAERVLIVAHSMGSALTMETLRQIAIAHHDGLMRRIAGVVLISPDIDVDVFRAQARRIGKLPQPFVIFTSDKDRVLALSGRLTGLSGRLGNVVDAGELADLQVVLLDTTAFSTGAAGHFNPGDSAALLAILSRLSDVEDAFAGDQTGRIGLMPGAVLTVRNASQIVLRPVAATSGLGR